MPNSRAWKPMHHKKWLLPLLMFFPCAIEMGNSHQATSISSMAKFFMILSLQIWDIKTIGDLMEEKTNAMRTLDRHKLAYQHYALATGDTPVSGTEAAALLGKDPAQVFKTLVTVGKSGKYYVFMIPVAEELDLKKAARCAGEKSIEMIKSKELLPLTGYVHGGCSPIGMKKQFPTFVQESAAAYPTITFSAGKIGHQVELPLASLQKVIPLTLGDLIVSR